MGGKEGGRRRPAGTVRRKDVRKLGLEGTEGVYMDGRRYKRCEGECEEKKKPLHDIT